jgi:uncharacterized protein
MRYNVAGLLRAPTGETREIQLEEGLDLEADGVRLVAPLRGRLRLIRDPAGVLVEGTLRSRVALECDRCLAPTEAELVVELSETFRPTVYLPGGPEPEPSDDDEPATQIDATHTIDLGEVVRQAVLVGLPLHPLCRAGCAGLCPRCGQDWNQGPCQCAPEPDERWAALRALLDEGES